jgi:hypothetical protein
MGNALPKNCASYVTPIHKKGSQRDTKNCRERAVICTIGRIYSKVLRNLAEKETATKQAKNSLALGLGSPQQTISLH